MNLNEATDTEPDDAPETATPDVIATVPVREDPSDLIVVGLGASAGGVESLQTFFQAVPTDDDKFANMAYVVVLHLSPDYESHLAEILGRVTDLPVQQLTEPVSIEKRHVYIIPPGKHMAMEDGMLHLSDPRQPRGHRIAIDLFFRTLAAAHAPQAVAVVLSGTGADGALGLKQVKELGGLTIAQEPMESAYGDMPRNAIATGLVDYVLPTREMPAQIASYWQASRQMRLPAEGAPTEEQRDDGPEAETALAAILSHLHGQTGHDFAQYKRATVLRRIARRLQVNDLLDFPAYLQFLRSHPAEISGLLSDLLISVTQFFRDEAAWEVIEREVIPRLFDNKGPGDEVRAWVCACATGEEAYSLAMLLLEHAARMDHPPRVQVFATDMDAAAIARSREGIYPNTINVDVSPERLRRWFYRDNGQFRLRDEVREVVLFARHDILKDTPFSRLDLVTCRNLLIYLKREAQERVFEIFHFALSTDGRLFLGSSEAIDSASPLFFSLDKQHRVYVRRPAIRKTPFIPSLPSPVTTAAPVLPVRWRNSEAGSPPKKNPEELTRFLSPGELHRDFLEMYAAPSVLVTEDHQILHLSVHAGEFLHFAGGVPTTNLIQSVQADLRLELTTALYTAAAEGLDQARIARRTVTGAGEEMVRIIVRPVRETEGARTYFLVLFETLTEGEIAPAQLPPSDPESQTGAARLLEEINRLQLQLRSTVEQYDASTEEQKASNEELQAVNEELRSASEELETGKEELQSVNEELITVNQELKHRIDEAAHANSDLQNLLISTDIATIFLDWDLQIKRYTPALATLFNVIVADVGRPFAHLTHHLDYDELPDDAARVLQELAPLSREVAAKDGRIFWVRLLPYRTADNRVDGVVLTFINITERKRAEDGLRASEARFRALISQAAAGIMQMDAAGGITFVNQRFCEISGYDEAELLGIAMEQITHPDDFPVEMELFTRLVQTGESFVFDKRYLCKDGSEVWVRSSTSSVRSADENAPSLLAVVVDITTRKLEEVALEKRVRERTAELAATTQVRRELLRQLVRAQETERGRISRELHDQMGQLMTAFLLGLSHLKSGDISPDAKETLARLQSLADELAGQSHQLSFTLRPTALDDLGLVAALDNYQQEWVGWSGIPVEIEAVGFEDGDARLSSEIETTVYRIVLEALTNILRHAASATQVSITLQHKPDEVLAVVEDNGPGFDVETMLAQPPEKRRLGLFGMQERAALVGGTLTIESITNRGTALFLRIPLG